MDWLSQAMRYEKDNGLIVIPVLYRLLLIAKNGAESENFESLMNGMSTFVFQDISWDTQEVLC